MQTATRAAVKCGVVLIRKVCLFKEPLQTYGGQDMGVSFRKPKWMSFYGRMYIFDQQAFADI